MKGVHAVRLTKSVVHILTRKEQLGSTAFQMNLPPGMSGYCAKRTTVTTAEVRLADFNNRGMLPSTEQSCLGQVLLLAELAGSGEWSLVRHMNNLSSR